MIRRQRAFRRRETHQHAHLRARGGFTLPELMVATMIMTVGVLALASGSAAVLRMMRDGNMQTLAATVAQARLETIRSQACASQSSGSATTRGMTEAWTLTALSTKIYAVAETVTYVPRAGATRKAGFNVVIPCA
jgi:prepilin-type N-terminal cleavage/methylation domain-containing protein